MKVLVILGIMLFFVGCKPFEKFIIPDDRLSKSYQVEKWNLASRVKDTITGSFVDYPVSELWEILPNNISYAFEESLFEKKITMECKNLNVEDFFGLIARQLQTDFTQDGEVFFIGKIDFKSFSVYITRISGFSEKEVQKIIDGVRSNEGKSVYMKGGILIYTDRWSSIQRIANVMRSLENIKLMNYEFDIWLVNESFLRQVYVKNGLEGRYSFDWSIGNVASYSNWQFILSDLMQFNVTDNKSLAIRHFSALLEDGETFTFDGGESVPVLKKTVSDSGTITTTGMDYVNVGTQIKSTIYRVNETRFKVEVEVEVSSSDRFIENYPVKNQSKYKSCATVKNGSVVVMGRYETTIAKKYLIGKEKENTNWLILISANVKY